MGNTIKKYVHDAAGNSLYIVIQGRTIYVSSEKHRDKKLYRLWDKGEKIATKSSLAEITKIYYEYIQDKKTVETIVYKPSQERFARFTKTPHIIEYTKEQIEEYENQPKFKVDNVWKRKPPKLTEEQLIKLKLNRNTDQEIIKNIEEDAISRYLLKKYDETSIKVLGTITGKKVITTPNINIKTVTHKYNRVDKNGKHIERENYQVHSIDKNYIIEEFLKMLADNPAEIAALTKIPQFLNLQTLYIPKKEQTPIDGLLDEYKKHIKQTIQDSKNINKNIADASNYFDEFKTITKSKNKELKYLEDIKLEDIKAYTSELYKVATDKTYKATWLKEHQIKTLQTKNNYPKDIWYQHRISKFITMLHIYTNNKISSNDSTLKKTIDNILFWISKSPEIKSSKKVNAQIISKEDFKKIYDNCKDDNKLFLKIALLNAFTLKDLADLKVEDINLSTGEILKNREKTGEIRVGYLPPTILQQVKKRITYQNQEYVFENFSVHGRRKYFYELTNRIKLPYIQFKMLRKTTATTATICPGINELQIKLLLGHSIKIETHYINKNMESIKKIVEYIQAEYLQDIA